MLTVFNPIRPQVTYVASNPFTWNRPEVKSKRIKLNDHLVNKVIFVEHSAVELRVAYGWELYQITDHTYGDLTRNCSIWLAVDSKGYGTIYIQAKPSRRKRITNLIQMVLSSEPGLDCTLNPISKLRITPVKD